MSNMMQLNRLIKNNNTEMTPSNQSGFPQIQFPDLRNNNHYKSSPFLNSSSDQQQLSLNFKPQRYGYKRETEQFRPKDRGLFGLYSRDGGSQKIQNLKSSLWEDEKKNSARGGNEHPMPEVKAFLDKISLLSNDPHHKDLKKREINQSQSGGMIDGLIKGHENEKSKKNEILNEWRQSLAVQVQVRQIQKRQEAENKRLQDIIEEERYQKRQDYSPSAHYDDGRYRDFQRESPFSYKYGYTNNNTPKNYDYAGEYQMQPKRMYKPFHSSTVSNTILNSKLDQLKTEILQSQKIFSDQMKGLQTNIERRRQNQIQNQNQHQIEREYPNSDALDEYMNQQEFQKDLRDKLSYNPTTFIPKLPSIHNPKLMLEDDGDPEIEDGSAGVIVGVEGQFVEIQSPNVRLSRAQSKKVISSVVVEETAKTPRPVSVGNYRRGKMITVEQEVVEVKEPEPLPAPVPVPELKEVKQEIIENQPEEVKENKLQEVIKTPRVEEAGGLFDLSPKNSYREEIKEVEVDTVKEKKPADKIFYNLKRAESAQKSRPETPDKDINKMFAQQTSVFVNTTNIETMDEFKRYIKKEEIPAIPINPKKDIALNPPPTSDYTKRRQIGTAEAPEDNFVGDLRTNVEKEAYKKRDLKRAAGL